MNSIDDVNTKRILEGEWKETKPFNSFIISYISMIFNPKRSLKLIKFAAFLLIKYRVEE